MRRIATLTEIADEVGVDRKTIRRWAANPVDPLPAYRPPGGRKLLFVVEDVLDWIRRHPMNQSAAPARRHSS